MPNDTATKKSSGKTFQHTYVCPLKACLTANNPHSGSWHQRAVNLLTATPRTDIECPGHGEHKSGEKVTKLPRHKMIIGRNSPPEDWKLDKEGNIASMGDGDLLVFEKTFDEAPDQTAEIEKENAA